MPTNNHDLNVPEQGTKDWHEPLNDNFEQLDAILKNISSDGETFTPSTLDAGEIVGSQRESTTELPSAQSDVRVASDFSGSNGGEMIQNAIDDLPSSGGVVLVGPEGPDDVSNSSGSVSDRRSTQAWEFSSTVQHGSNVFVVLEGAYCFRTDDGAGVGLFHNSDQKSGNSNLGLLGAKGATIDGNSPNNSEEKAVDDNETAYIRCEDVAIGGLHHGGLTIRNTLGWGAFLQNPTSGWIGNICGRMPARDSRNTIMVSGGAQRTTIENVYGQHRDDMIAVQTKVGNFGKGGTNTAEDVIGVTIRNINGERVGSMSSNLIRIFPSVDSSTSEQRSMRGVSISQCLYTDGFNLLNLGFGGESSTVESFRNVSVSDCYSTNCNRLILQEQSASQIQVSNCYHDSSGEFYKVANGSTIQDLTISGGGKRGADASTYGAINSVGATIDGLRVQNWTCDGQASSAVGVRLDDQTNVIGEMDVSGTFRDCGGVIGIQDSTTLSAPVSINVSTPGTDEPWRYLDKTVGVTRGGIGQEAVGSSGPPTTSNWAVGDIVENTSSSPPEVYLLRPGESWLQIS